MATQAEQVYAPAPLFETGPQTTVVVSQQPGMTVGAVSAQTVQGIPIQLRDWTSGICGCFEDCGSCMCGWCCFPCLACDVSRRLGENCCVPTCVPGGLIALRTKLRTLYGISGSICNDGSVFCWCAPCALCQMDRELTTMGVN